MCVTCFEMYDMIGLSQHDLEVPFVTRIATVKGAVYHASKVVKSSANMEL